MSDAADNKAGSRSARYLEAQQYGSTDFSPSSNQATQKNSAAWKGVALAVAGIGAVGFWIHTEVKKFSENLGSKPAPQPAQVQTSETSVTYLAGNGQMTADPREASAAAQVVSPAVAGLDGTHEPYVMNLSDQQIQDLKDGKTVNHVFQGEGWDRERDRNGNVVTRQEGGRDIYLSMSYNKETNTFSIEVDNKQTTTGQLTNFRVLYTDGSKKDLTQLPPDYDITVTLNGQSDVIRVNAGQNVRRSFQVNGALESVRGQGDNIHFPERQEFLRRVQLPQSEGGAGATVIEVPRARDDLQSSTSYLLSPEQMNMLAFGEGNSRV